MPSRRGFRWDQGNSRLEVQVNGTVAARFDDTGSYLTIPAGGLTITAGGLTVTAGTIKAGDSAHWTANASGTVTISNVAPAGVGTATITKWLTVTDDSDVVMYIPAWT